MRPALLALGALTWLAAGYLAAAPAKEPPPDRVAQLIAKLKAPEGWAEAWDQLLAIGLPAVPKLQQCLNSEDERLAVRAAALLYRMGSRATLTVLAQKLNSEVLEVRTLAAGALKAIAGDPFAYDPAAPVAERKAAAEKWLNWASEEAAKDPATDRIVVVAVDNAEGVVVLNVGGNNGVKPGATYTLARGDKFVAVVKVERVMARLCVARVNDGEIQRPIQLGDVALQLNGK